MTPDAPQLPAVGLIAHLSQKDRDSLSSYGAFHTARPGEVLIEQGKPHGKLFFIINGLFHARRSDGGNDVLFGPVSAGEWFGEVDIFDPSVAVCSVVAVEKCEYWVISRANLEEFINTHPKTGSILLIGLASTISRRIRDLTRKIAEQAELYKIREHLFIHSESPALETGTGSI